MKLFAILSLFILYGSTLKSQEMSAEKIVQMNLDAYNEKNIDKFMSYFSTDIQIRNFDSGEISATGLEEVRKIYSELFKKSPDLHSKILKRISFDNKVIDHEFITGRSGSSVPLELVLIYEVQSQLISRITVIRKN